MSVPDAPPDGDGLIVIATALPEEFEEIARAASCVRQGKPTVGSSSRGRMGQRTVRIVLTGDGPARAAAALPIFEENSWTAPFGATPVAAFIGAGVCGALSPGLSPGVVLVSCRILDDAGDAPAPDADLVARAVALGAKEATFVTVSRPLISSNEKREAAERVGGAEAPGPAAAAVDMESAAWAHAAAKRGVPFVVLRSVMDTLDESLPSFLADCIDSSGSIDRARVARCAALRPWSIPRLLSMRERVVDASTRLAEFLTRFLGGGIARG